MYYTEGIILSPLPLPPLTARGEDEDEWAGVTPGQGEKGPSQRAYACTSFERIRKKKRIIDKFVSGGQGSFFGSRGYQEEEETLHFITQMPRAPFWIPFFQKYLFLLLFFLVFFLPSCVSVWGRGRRRLDVDFNQGFFRLLLLFLIVWAR